MTDRRVTEDTAILGAAVAAGDLFDLVDVSDTTDAATGTSKKITAAEMRVAMGSGWTTNAYQLAHFGFIQSSQDDVLGKATIANDHLYSYELVDTLAALAGGGIVPDNDFYAAADGWIQILRGGMYGVSAQVKWPTANTDGHRYVGLIAGPDDGGLALGQQNVGTAQPANIMYKFQPFGHQIVTMIVDVPEDNRLPFDIGIQVWQDSGVDQVVLDVGIQVAPFVLF